VERIAVCHLPEQIEGAGTAFEDSNNSSSLRGVSPLKLRRAQFGYRYSLQRVPPRKVLDDFCGVRFSVANAASRARRNIRSLAIFVRSACARCSYSGIERAPPDRGPCLKRSSASSLEVMRLSSALKLDNAVAPDVEVAWVNGAETRIGPKTRRWSRSSQAEPASFIQGSPSLV
jgi:hypothetical protein